MGWMMLGTAVFGALENTSFSAKRCKIGALQKQPFLPPPIPSSTWCPLKKCNLKNPHGGQHSYSYSFVVCGKKSPKAFRNNFMQLRFSTVRELSCTGRTCYMSNHSLKNVHQCAHSPWRVRAFRAITFWMHIVCRCLRWILEGFAVEPREMIRGEFSEKWFGFRPESRSCGPEVRVTDQKSELPSDTKLLLTKNHSEINIFWKITNLMRNSLKMSVFPGHFERTKCLKIYEK